jgi:thymidylate synthase
MRTYQNCYELISEIAREVLEMGIRVHPNSMQNKVVKGDDNYSTLEITNYSYCLLSLDKVESLFTSDPRSKDWVLAEFLERINSREVNPGDAYKIREDVWSQFLVDGKFDYSYSERMNFNNNLNRLLVEASNNIDSRQLILPIFHATDVENIGGYKRVPCSIYYQFLIRNGQVDIVYAQRSADVFTHFGNDVFLAWRLMVYFATQLKLKPGYLYHNIGSLHVYNKDTENLRKCLKERL